MIAVVDENDGRPMILCFFGCHAGVGGDDDFVAGLHAAGGGAIECDFTLFSGDDIGAEALTVVDVVDIDFFPGEDAGGLNELLVDRYGSLIIDIGACDGRTVNFSFK